MFFLSERFGWDDLMMMDQSDRIRLVKRLSRHNKDANDRIEAARGK